jgi:TPP-dependent pyruvate/acetoin dehydrogenase alpha subunit
VTAKSAGASTAYENPLIPNARLRQIYLAMLQARMLEKALPAARRARAAAEYATGIAGLEACLVSATIDLGPGDLVSDALSGGVVEYLRGVGLGEVLRAGSKRAKQAASASSGPRGMIADCGRAAALPGAPGIAERLWAVMGAAAALKAAAIEAKKAAKAEDAAQPQQGLVVAYVRPGEATAAVWRRAFEYAAVQVLPVVFVVMPGETKAGGVSELARECGVPGIAVDGDDAVAIYRVAQESIGRARAGGGAVLLECVPFVLHGGAGKPTPNAIAGIEQYMLQRGVVTRRWMEREAKSFQRRLAAAKAAAK